MAGAAVLASSALAYDFPYLCDDDDGWVEDDCCETAPPPGLSCPTGSLTGIPTSRPNIVLVIADDHDYCLYSFMAGLCSKNPSIDCTTDSQCWTSSADYGRCVGSRELGTCSSTTSQSCADQGDCPGSETCNLAQPPSDLPLRLNDLACRNRQPKRPSAGANACTGPDDEPKLDKKGNLTFDRGEAPCSGTPGEGPPVARTPHLDALAKQAAVFPRAYVAGTWCKNSRRTMLHGRYMRHLQWLFANGAKGTYQCDRDIGGDPAVGCSALSSTTSPCTGTLPCEQAHTVARWPQRGVPTTSSDHDYRAFAFGKTDVMSAGQGGFSAEYTLLGDSVAKATCMSVAEGTERTACETVLGYKSGYATTAFPTAVMFDQPVNSLYRVTQAIDSTIAQDAATQSSYLYTQPNPFFIWFAPALPHKGKRADQFFLDMYDGRHKKEHEHYARVTWFDAVVGGLFYHLKRACVCNESNDWESLWANTVVLFLSDQGFLLPGAKRNTFEQTQRTPLIVSTPEHRQSTSPTEARVFDGELASAIDLMPTVMTYAQQRYFSGDALRDDYPFGRDLTQLIATGAWPTDGSVTRRDLSFGEEGRPSVHGMDHTTDGGYPRHIVTRPGLLGVCEKPYNFSESNPGTDCGPGDRCHVHPCLSDGDCAWSGVTLGNCVCPPTSESPDCDGTGTGGWQRCVNRPGVRCDPDDSNGQAECAADDDRYDALCVSGACVHEPAEGSFKDFVDRDCTSDVECVPPGVCRPLLLKVEANDSDSGLRAAWDLDYAPDWDPRRDRQADVNLVKDSSYLRQDDETLGESLMECLRVFKNLDTSDRWDDDTETLNCPDELADWRVQ